ncbi:Exported protein [Escherichia coli]|nr:Exported protein [Escherichia coli]
MKKVVLMALALGLSLPAMASEKVIDMYKSENCGCCSLWGKAMEKDGFEVRTHVMNDQALSALKEKHAIPAGLRSCHTAVAGNLIIEAMCLRQRYIRQCSLVQVYTVSPPPVCQQEVLEWRWEPEKRLTMLSHSHRMEVKKSSSESNSQRNG